MHQQNTLNETIDNDPKNKIRQAVMNSCCGLSLREICRITRLGFRVVKRYVEVLRKDSYSNIRVKEYGRMFLVYYDWTLPSGDLRREFVEMARRNKYPIHLIVAKVWEVDPNAFVLSERGRKQTLSSLIEAIHNVKEEICWWAGDFSSFWRIKEAILNRLDDDVQLKVLMNIGPVSYENAKQIVNLKEQYSSLVDIRHWESEWRGTIFDGKRLRLVWKMPRNIHDAISNGKMGNDSRYAYVPWETTRRDWVNVFHDIIWEDHWKMAAMSPNPKSILKIIAQGKYEI